MYEDFGPSRRLWEAQPKGDGFPIQDELQDALHTLLLDKATPPRRVHPLLTQSFVWLFKR